MAQEIAWTPEGSVMGLGSILLRRMPLKDLTLEQYRMALSERIDRLIAKETPEAARAMLEPLESLEPLALNPRAAGEVLAFNSDQLLRMSGQTAQDWPQPRGAIKHEPETKLALDAETLEMFLANLFQPETA